MKTQKILFFLILVLIIPGRLLAETKKSRSFFLGSNLSGLTLFTEYENETNIIADFKIGYFISNKSAFGIGFDLDLNREKGTSTLTQRSYLDFTFSYSYYFENRLIFEALIGFGKMNFRRIANDGHSYYHYRFKFGIGCSYLIFISSHLALIPGIYIGELIENYSKYPDYNLNLYSSLIDFKIGLYYYF